MINEVKISRLDELVGDYDTPFINYLLYSYDFSINECEVIVNNLKSDINSNKVKADNMASTLEDYFNSEVINLEKDSKIDYLSELLNPEGDFFGRFLEKYGLNQNEIDLVYNKVEDRILKENLSEFEIKRYIEYYFLNTVKQSSYIKDLDRIVGRGYDTLYIKKAMKMYPILQNRDIVQIIFDIHGDIIDAKEFRKGIRAEFYRQCMLKSESKKAAAISNLQKLVEGSGDSFSKLVALKGLSKKDGEIIVSEIEKDIYFGSLQPEQIDNIFLTKRFNEYRDERD